MYDVVVIGSANLDLVVTTPRMPRPGESVIGTGFAQHAGGKGLNQAVAAARSGVSVCLVGALGDDDAGSLLRSIAEAEHIDTSLLMTVEATPTGRAVITVDSEAENSIVVIPGANGTVRCEQLPSAGVVLAQLEIPARAVSAAFAFGRAAGGRTVLNPSPVPREGIPEELLAVCDIIVPNEHEIDLLGGVDHLFAAGVATVIITRGAAGVTVLESPSATPWTLDAFEVDPVDTTGAGDAFCGALASRIAAGDDLRTAVRYACAAGAIATTIAGAVASLPSAQAITALLGQSAAPRTPNHR